MVSPQTIPETFPVPIISHRQSCEAHGCNGLPPSAGVSLDFQAAAVQRKYQKNNYILDLNDSLYKKPCLKIFCSKAGHL